MKKYTSPFASVKMAGKECKSAFKAGQLSGDSAGGLQAATNVKTFNGKLAIKPVKGWKTLSISYYNDSKIKTFKGKLTLSLEKVSTLWIDMKNAKTGQVESFIFNAMGGNYKYFKDWLRAA